MFRKIKNEFKVQIYKEDLKPVLIRGFLTTLMYACLLSVVNILLIEMFNLSTSLLIVLLGFFISKEVASNYYSRHIIYPYISVIFLFIGMILYHSMTVILAYKSISVIFVAFKLGFLQTISPFNIFLYFETSNLFNALLYLFIILYAIYFTYRNSKNNYY